MFPFRRIFQLGHNLFIYEPLVRTYIQNRKYIAPNVNLFISSDRLLSAKSGRSGLFQDYLFRSTAISQFISFSLTKGRIASAYASYSNLLFSSRFLKRLLFLIGSKRGFFSASLIQHLFMRKELSS